MKQWLIRFVESTAGRRGRWVALAVWIGLAAVLTVFLPGVQSEKKEFIDQLPESSMSVQAAKLANEEFPNDAGMPLLLVWERQSGLTLEDMKIISGLYKKLAGEPLPQQNFLPPLDKVPPQALLKSASEDGKAMITPVFLKEKAGSEAIEQDINRVRTEVKKLAGKDLFSQKLGQDGLRVRATGPAGIAVDAVSLFSAADFKLMAATLILVVVLLVLLYRSPILPFVPLIGVGFAYAVISPLLGIMANKGLIQVDSQAVSIMTVLLFGAGTDYCLFLVSRYRECLLKERDHLAALKAAIHSSGGAIMVSALTTAFGLLTLLLAYYGSYHTFAVPFSLAIFIMGLAALTLLPAILSILGRVSFFPFIPRTEEMARELEKTKGKPVRRTKPHSAFSFKLGNTVTKRPVLTMTVSLLLLGGLAAFAPKIQYTYDLLSSFPNDMPSREGFHIIEEHFPSGNLAPVEVIIDTDGKDVPLSKELTKLPYIKSVAEGRPGQKNADILSFDISLNQNPYDIKSLSVIPELKEQTKSALKQAGISNPEEKVWIGGETAKLYDTKEITDRDKKVIVPVVIAIIALLLLLYLRSIVAMIYLLLTVLLSYFSALGAGWLLMHYGLGTEAIQGLIPLYTFVFIVALGEDYNIFMVSSIWKKRQSLPLQKAIADGVSETSGVITSAGLILAGTFAVLATLPIQVLVQFGIVTAIGVLLDTFVVRPLLVPAITTLLGRYAFWPGRLWKRE